MKNPMGLNARVVARLREEADKRNLSYNDLAGFLQWSHSKVTKKMTQRTMIDLDELEALCFAVGIQPTEAVRDRGLEFVAEMTPTELRLLELIRKLPKPAYDGLLHFLQVTPSVGAEQRGATPKRASGGKPRR